MFKEFNEDADISEEYVKKRMEEILEEIQEDENNAMPFVIKKSDGTEIRGTCYPDKEELSKIK